MKTKQARNIIYACCLFGSSIGRAFPLEHGKFKISKPLKLLSIPLSLETFEDYAQNLTRCLFY